MASGSPIEPFGAADQWVYLKDEAGGRLSGQNPNFVDSTSYMRGADSELSTAPPKAAKLRRLQKLGEVDSPPSSESSVSRIPANAETWASNTVANATTGK
jgi:hypothetical protein